MFFFLFFVLLLWYHIACRLLQSHVTRFAVRWVGFVQLGYLIAYIQQNIKRVYRMLGKTNWMKTWVWSKFIYNSLIVFDHYFRLGDEKKRKEKLTYHIFHLICYLSASMIFNFDICFVFLLLLFLIALLWVELFFCGFRLFYVLN